MFSESTQNCLLRAGWTPDRRVPTQEWTDELESEGFTILPDAQRLLANLGGLEVQPVKDRRINVYAPGIVHFDPVSAASGEFDGIDLLQKQLDTVLTPLAEVSGRSILLLAGDGRVYLGWTDVVWLVGHSFEAALDTLLLARTKPIEIQL